MHTIISFCRGLVFYTQLIFACRTMSRKIKVIPRHYEDEREQLQMYRTHASAWMKKFWARKNITVEVKNLSLVSEETTKAGIYMLNHESFLEVQIAMAYIPGPYRFVSTTGPEKTPWLGDVYAFPSILVDRKNKDSMVRCFNEIRRCLKAGINIVICPEGTRNTTNLPVLDFPEGGPLFLQAMRTKTPIIVVVTIGTRAILPKNLAFTKGKAVMCLYHKIDTSSYTKWETLKADVHRIMTEGVLDLRDKHKNDIAVMWR